MSPAYEQLGLADPSLASRPHFWAERQQASEMLALDRWLGVVEQAPAIENGPDLTGSFQGSFDCGRGEWARGVVDEP